MVSTRPKNATQHPGDVVKQATRKRRTAKQIAADNERAREAQEAQELAAKNGIDRVGAIEASMEIEQAAAVAKSKDERTLQGLTDDDMDVGGDYGDEVEMAEPKPKKKKKVSLLLREAVSAARLKKQNEDRSDIDLIDAPQPGRPVDGKAHGLDKKGNNVEGKKFSLSGKINNWRDQVEPDSKGKSSKASSVRSGTSIPCSTTDSVFSRVTSTTTFSQATEPPPTPTKTSKSQADHTLKATYSDDGDLDESDSDSEERAAAIAEKGQGKAAMTTVIEIESGTDTDVYVTVPSTGSKGKNKAVTRAKVIVPGTPQESDTDDNRSVSYALEQGAPRAGKRKLDLGPEDNSNDYEDGDGDDVMEFEDDTMQLDSEIEGSTQPIAKEANKVVRTTSATNTTAVEKPIAPLPAKKVKLEPASKASTKVPRPAKKVKSEPASKVAMTRAPDVPESMLADMATKPAPGSTQWRNTDLPPLMMVNKLWRKQFIPTVLLWAGSQPNFWTIEAADLLAAGAGHFQRDVPRREASNPTQGPHHGCGHPATTRTRTGVEDENTDNEEQYMVQMATSLLEGYAFLFADPDTCKPSEIYRSVFTPQASVFGINKGL
ncbi:hypothetical protein DEU56DRAFT_912781 [Suillus clintonianus]|uniref:uncharacterized protein n=1 Tax=Suillus clintonianus TaxID=1904413 RepID=UPI001B85C4B0|nr:uncharacterized protein DEU56DRAFT_912781 [Suillus clintonianus]KAG2137010.1 hypothetical protein DEU56DRAFT_912781 [Suillus clintonianus]